ncbi:MAG: 50S ribosomal protein L19 [Clostridia bacterium]|nr:50S ribosomal protein L19 [Clostridia bacterium]
MDNSIIATFTQGQLKQEKPGFKIGDTVKVYQYIYEGDSKDKKRIQTIEGTVIAMHNLDTEKGGDISSTFTIRRISYGVGVEKVFPYHSPMIQKIEVVRLGKVRRAKLYYLRGRVGKASKVKEEIKK